MKQNLTEKFTHKQKDHQFSSKFNEIFRQRTTFLQNYFDKIKLNIFSPSQEKLLICPLYNQLNVSYLSFNHRSFKLAITKHITKVFNGF